MNTRPILLFLILCLCGTARPSDAQVQPKKAPAQAPGAKHLPSDDAGGRAFAKLCVIPLTPVQNSRFTYDAQSVITQLTDKTQRLLTSYHVPLVPSGIVARVRTEDEIIQLARQMQQNGARYVLTGYLTDLQSDRQTADAGLTLEAELRDVRTGQPLRHYKVAARSRPKEGISREGIEKALGNLKDIFKKNGRNPLDGILGGKRDSSNSSEDRARLLDAAVTNAAAELAQRVVEDYPESDIGDEDPLDRPARWLITGPTASLRTAVEQVTRRLVSPGVMEKQKETLATEIFANADQFAAQAGKGDGGVSVFLTSPGPGKQSLPGKLRSLQMLRPMSIIVMEDRSQKGNASSRRYDDGFSLKPAQVELINRLDKAGFDLRSQEQESKVREAESFRELLKGNPDPEKVRSLQKEANVDAVVLIQGSGEALRNGRRQEDGEEATAQVIVTAYRLDTGALIASAQQRQTGHGPTAETARGAALQNAAAAVIPELVENLFIKGYSGGPTSDARGDAFDVSIEPLADFNEAQDLMDALKKVKGIKRVFGDKWSDPRLTFKVEVDPTADIRVATVLSRDPALKKFRIVIKEVEGSRIRATVK